MSPLGFVARPESYPTDPGQNLAPFATGTRTRARRRNPPNYTSPNPIAKLETVSRKSFPPRRSPSSRRSCPPVLGDRLRSRSSGRRRRPGIGPLGSSPRRAFAGRPRPPRAGPDRPSGIDRHIPPWFPCSQSVARTNRPDCVRLKSRSASSPPPSAPSSAQSSADRCTYRTDAPSSSQRRT